MNVLSLFDGMSCGQIALNKANIPYDKYFASEIDSDAIKVTQHNYPNTIQLGDVTKISGKDLPKIDLLIGGSPCQGFSFAGKQLNFDDPRSRLFFEFVRLKNELNPKYFLLENVKMKNESKDVITRHIGVEPIMINSSLVSAQNRERLYWTNIPNINQLEDKGIYLKDILSTEYVGDKYNIKPERVDTLLKFLSKVYVIQGKTPTLTTELAHSTGKNFYPKFLAEIHETLGCYRRITPNECEKLQTLPNDYTNIVSDTQRYKMIGNGWTVDVIAHIFKNIK